MDFLDPSSASAELERVSSSANTPDYLGDNGASSSITVADMALRPARQRPQDHDILDRGNATRADWEAQRDAIRRLYQIQAKPLKEVMHTMAREHKFVASENMYKKQLKKWGMDVKRLRPRDYAHILFLRAQHDQTPQAGENPVILVRGREVSWKEVRRAQRRNPEIKAAYSAEAATYVVMGSAATPETSRGPGKQAGAWRGPNVCRLPPLEGPQEVALCVELGILLSDYVTSSITTQKWSFELGFPKSSVGAYERLSEWWALGSQGVSLVRKGKMAPGFAAISKMMDQTSAVIADETPELLIFLLYFVFFFIPPELSDLGEAVRRHFTRLIGYVLGQRHPITVTMARFRREIQAYLEDVVIRRTTPRVTQVERHMYGNEISRYEMEVGGALKQKLDEALDAMLAERFDKADQILADAADMEATSIPYLRLEAFKFLSFLKYFAGQHGVKVGKAKKAWKRRVKAQPVSHVIHAPVLGSHPSAGDGGGEVVKAMEISCRLMEDLHNHLAGLQEEDDDDNSEGAYQFSNPLIDPALFALQNPTTGPGSLEDLTDY